MKVTNVEVMTLITLTLNDADGVTDEYQRVMVPQTVSWRYGSKAVGIVGAIMPHGDTDIGRVAWKDLPKPIRKALRKAGESR